MADKNKCAHPSCLCPRTEGSDYCGAVCEDASGDGTVDILCPCGHPACAAA